LGLGGKLRRETSAQGIWKLWDGHFVGELLVQSNFWNSICFTAVST